MNTTQFFGFFRKILKGLINILQRNYIRKQEKNQIKEKKCVVFVEYIFYSQ